MLRRIFSPLLFRKPRHLLANGSVAAAEVFRRDGAARIQRYCSSGDCETNDRIQVEPDIFTLKNGFRIICEESIGLLSCVSLFIKVGPRCENRNNNGTTHFIEHMAFKGVHSRNRQFIEEFVARIGAKLMMKTSREYQVITAVCTQECVCDMINLLFCIINELAFDENQMEMARHAVTLELQDKDVDPRSVTFDYLHQSAFQGTGLGFGVRGPFQNYCNFEPQSLMEFMRKHYTPKRLVLAVTSKYKMPEIECIVETTFGCIPDKTGAVDCAWHSRYTGSSAWYRNDDMDFTHVAMAVETNGYFGKDYLPLLVMKNILGHWDVSQCQGYSTWPSLAQGASVSHLCSQYHSFYLPYSDVGLFGVYYVAPKGTDLEDMQYLILEEWKILCTFLLQKDVERAIAATKIELGRTFHGTINSCFNMGYQLLLTNTYTCLDDICNDLLKVNRNRVMEVANDIIYDRCPVVSAVGATETLPNYARTRAGMYWLRL